MSEYVKMIEHQDQTLSELRDAWLNANDDDKQSHLNKIDNALDLRLHLMTKRDEERK